MSAIMNFAIVGYGMIAEIHARSIAEIPGARLVAVCGNDGEKARGFAARHGAIGYDHYDRMLVRADIDAVCVLTPSGSHAELGTAAAAAG
ncbi:Gfo/Idh/MocA family protein, partial [Paenibacillus agaridevorans]|uniref:Gfo/Idh/MocA family protein n=1 Tax=Paenibacillus agaridevorans TaxID=171404 RepID=UPI0015E80F6A